MCWVRAVLGVGVKGVLTLGGVSPHSPAAALLVSS